jgi:hypothetical protein
MTAPCRRWFSFSLRTLLLWLIPYVAVVAWVASWKAQGSYFLRDSVCVWYRAAGISAATPVLIAATAMALLRRWAVSNDEPDDRHLKPPGACHESATLDSR